MNNTNPHSEMPMLELNGVTKHFPVYGGILGRQVGAIRAVEGVSFSIGKGEVVGLVGESGCGKSTLGKTVLRLIEPTQGGIRFDGVDLLELSGRDMRKMRRKMQMIFQDPYSSLNPRMTVGAIVGEAMVIHKLVKASERKARVLALMQEVGLRPEYYSRYPHEFSGGQRQRIGIARALAVEPRFIVADEPVSALDVSIQAQIINLLGELKERHGLTYLFISHDLKVIKHICDRVMVMYLGKLVEILDSADLPQGVCHPYTEALVSAIPVTDPVTKRKRIVLSGDVPSPMKPPAGCVFHTRCPIAEDRCKKEIPVLRGATLRHQVACHRREI